MYLLKAIPQLLLLVSLIGLHSDASLLDAHGPPLPRSVIHWWLLLDYVLYKSTFTLQMLLRKLSRADVHFFDDDLILSCDILLLDSSDFAVSRASLRFPIGASVFLHRHGKLHRARRNAIMALIGLIDLLRQILF